MRRGGRHRARRGVAAAAGFALLAGSAVSVLGGIGAASADAATLPANCSQASIGADVVCTFSYTGTEQTFTVPTGVSGVHVGAIGAAGAGSDAIYGSDGYSTATTASSAGQGALVTGDLTVGAIHTLYVEVGGTPTVGSGCYTDEPCVGGFNGGGDSDNGAGGGGGGASDVRTVSAPESGSLGSRLLVAAGGGGGGAGLSCQGGSTAAGGAGGNAGQAGAPGAPCPGITASSTGGGAGSQSAGGARGSNSYGGETTYGQPGRLGTGGPSSSGGAGAGGGLYGGGGGGGLIDVPAVNTPPGISATGAGGGSSLVPAGGSVTTTGDSAGVTISYTPPGPATGLVLDPATDSVTAGTAVTFHAQTVNAAGASLADVTASTTFSSAAGSCTGAVCTLTKAGTGSVTGVDGGLSASASVTVAAGAPLVASYTGAGQSTAVDTAFRNSLTVTVDDRYGNPIVGLVFTFTVHSGPASFPGGGTSATATTDAHGTATAPTLTAGGTPGVVDVEASAAGIPSTVGFLETVGIAPIFTADSPPAAAVVGTPYSYAFTATGAPAPTFTVSSGALPAGLTLSAAGVLSGTPITAGTATFTVTASNAVGTISSNITITVHPAVTITTNSLPAATVGVAYHVTLQASGGSGAPPVWSVATGSTLPPGLTLSAAGALSGTPTSAGSYRFTVDAADPASATLTLTVHAAPVTPTPAPTSTTGELAFTGVPVGGLLALAGMLLPAGAVIVRFGRGRHA